MPVILRGNKSVDSRICRTIPAVNCEASGMTWLEVGVLQVFEVPRDYLPDGWVASSQKDEDGVLESIEHRLHLILIWIQVHQVHSALKVGDQSPPVCFFIDFNIFYWRC